MRLRAPEAKRASTNCIDSILFFLGFHWILIHWLEVEEDTFNFPQKLWKINDPLSN